jgi:hypothetical protein
MTGIRRVLILSGLTLAVIVGSGIPASATFVDTVGVSTAITTGTVAAPTGVTVSDSCVTTTTTVKQTVYTDPVTGARTTRYYSSSTTQATSTSNVQGTDSSTVAGPGAYETTTTTVTRNTNLHVSLSWTASTSRGVTGYVVSAHLGVNGSVAPLLGTTGTTVSQVQDADALVYQPSLLVTTQTSYGWTADSARTAVLAC